MRPTILTLLATLTLSPLATAQAVGVDQRTPEYRESLESLAQAAQSLRAAQDLVTQARRTDGIPGVRYQRLLDDIQAIEKEINVFLLPEERRRRHKTLTPDSRYLEPR